VLIRAVPFHAGAQGRIGTILALADITELRAAQSERDDVLRFLSHDMKSPASSLLGLAQLQRDPNRALAPRELTARLELLAQRLLTLVDGFVSLARAGSTDPRAFDDFDVCDAIRDAYDEVWASARARNSSINAAISEEPVMVHGDRQLLARAVVNLLSNALKFSGLDASVDLTCRQSGHEVIIRVADHGPGIAPDAASLLFQRFSRGLHRGTADPGGAGLGLAFVRVVAEKHRGRAWVEAGEGYGAVFCLSLPASLSAGG
jgi:signal transduction histidine kinase